MNLNIKERLLSYKRVLQLCKKPSKEDVLVLGDKLSKALDGSGAVFNLDTHE